MQHTYDAHSLSSSNQWTDFIMHPLHILVVDDDPAFLMIMDDILSKKNAILYMAQGGKEAIALFKKHNPDIVLMDLNMPQINGFEAIAAIKALLGDVFVPIITVNAFDDEKILRQALHCGADDFLTKPVNADVLIAKINTMLRIKQLYDNEHQQRMQLKNELEKSRRLALELSRTKRLLEKQNTALQNANIQLDQHKQRLQHEVFRQISELRQKDLKMIEKDREASLYTLASGMAHEINNPLGFIKSSFLTLDKRLNKFFENLLKQYLDESDIQTEQVYIKKILQRIFRGMDRIIDIVAQLKTFSNVDMGSVSYTNLNTCINNSLSLLKTVMNNQINVSTCFEDIPEIICSQKDINQCCYNILKNAVDAIEIKQEKLPPGAEQGVIGIQTKLVDNGIQVQIKDNGIGMSKDECSKALLPFFTQKPIGQGSGLGLTLAESCMNNHDGKLVLQSKPWEGTTVTLLFPIDSRKKILRGGGEDVNKFVTMFDKGDKI